MNSRMKIIPAIMVILFSGLSLAFAQDPAVQGGVVSDITKPETEIQWLWGDVVSADIPKGEVVIKYLDYEADEEKEVAVSVDEKTTFDNAKSIEDIKPGDTVSIDYRIDVEGRNIAKAISVEKPETEEVAPSVAESPVMQPEPNVTIEPEKVNTSGMAAIE